MNIYIASKDINTYLSNSKLSTLVGGDDIAPSGENDNTVSPEEVQLMQRMHKHRDTDFKSYLITFFNNTPKYSALIATDAYKANNWGSELMDWKYPKPIKGVPEEVVEAVRVDWMNISDVEIKKAFKYSTTGLYRAIRNKEKIDDNYINDIKNKYESDYKERVSLDRYKNIYYKVVLSGLKKDAKKYKQEFDEKTMKEFLKSVILKDTILENYTLSTQLKYELEKEYT